MDWLASPEAWVALATLTFLEIVLGIDNLVFVSILTGRLPQAQRSKARRVGLLLAMGMRIGLLFTLSALLALTAPCLHAFGRDVSGRDLILLGGGVFLMWKSVTEIHHKLEGPDDGHVEAGGSATAGFGSALVQIALLDLVFSLDSVITAVGMVEQVSIMVIAVLASVAVMVAFVNPICAYVERHPTIKMLALSFLLLIGFTLVGEGSGLHVPKGYVYFAMGFSIFVELLNLKLRKAGKPIDLHGPERPAP